MEIEQQLTELTTEMKAFSGKAQEEIRNLGSVTTETKAALDTMRGQLTAIQTQLDAVDLKTQHRHVAGTEEKSFGERFVSDPRVIEAKAAGFGGRGAFRVTLNSSAFPLSTKTNISETNLGSGTSGVLMPVRLPGIVGMAQIALRVRDVMNVIPQTIGNSFDYVYQATRTNSPSPQNEAEAKTQSYYNWATGTGTIRTIAHWVKVTRQALDDLPWLRGLIDAELIYGLKVKEEAEILSGDGNGVNLNGIITQATEFDTATYLSAATGWTRIDILRYAMLQARLAGLATYPPSAFILHPTDLAQIDLTKNTIGNYIISDPRTGVNIKYIWGLPVVESDSISAGTFLVGAFANAVDLIDRMSTTVEIAYQHDTDFTSNLATVLCEERIGLAVKVAGAFITGSFTTSP